MTCYANSPLRAKAPGFATISKYLEEMWEEAEARREEWGCAL